MRQENSCVAFSSLGTVQQEGSPIHAVTCMEQLCLKQDAIHIVNYITHLIILLVGSRQLPSNGMDILYMLIQ